MEIASSVPEGIHAALDSIPCGLLLVDSDLRLSYANRPVTPYLPYLFSSVDELSESPALHEPTAVSACRRALSEGRGTAVRTTMNGVCYEALISLIPSGLSLFFREIYDGQSYFIAPPKNGSAEGGLLENIPGMAYRATFDGSEWRNYYVSPGCLALTGYGPEHFLTSGHFFLESIVLPEYRENILAAWRKVVAQKASFRQQYRIRKLSGEILWVKEMASGTFESDGTLSAVEGIVMDISAQKESEREIEYLLNHDYLTGLYNRIFFEREKQKCETGAILPISVITADINGLRLINDALGVAKGDRLIQMTAGLIRECFTESAIVARIGGDEFAILLPNVDEKGAEEAAHRIREACLEHNRKIANELEHVSLSLGYAVKDMADISIDSVMKLADEYMNKRKLFERKSFHSAIVEAIRTTMNDKSQETEEHAERIVRLTRMIGMGFGLSAPDLSELELFAALHDIGKIGIVDQILNKPGKLTDEEWAQMKRHSEIGYHIALSSPELTPIAEYILSHHERFDGSGYPQGISGQEIPFAARILAVADAYDAMTQDRVYRKALGKEEAIRELSSNRGTQFDPDVVDVFLRLLTENTI